MISFGDYPAHITLKDHFLIFPFGKNFGLLKILRAQKFKFSQKFFCAHFWSTFVAAFFFEVFYATFWDAFFIAYF